MELQIWLSQDIIINILPIPTSLLAEMSVMFALRCLGILLIPTKTKRADGDIPFILRFVPVSYFTTKVMYLPNLLL